MYFFFPDNYMWSQGVLRLLYTGGAIGEIARVVPVLQEASRTQDAEAWLAAWVALGDHLWQQGEQERQQEHPRSAGASFYRACAYYQWAITFVSHDHPRRKAYHQRSLDAFARFAAATQPPIERVEVAYEGTALPAWFIPGAGSTARKPTVCFLPGLESTKEQGAEFGLALAQRGFNVLLVDGPGVGESVLYRGLINRYDEEAAGRADFAYLASRPDVDAARIALVGLSLGGYRAARVVAFEQRYAACVLWGAIWDFGAIWEQRLLTTGGPASATHEHMLHVFGGQSLDDVTKILRAWRLEGIANRIRCPLLILHGQEDHQIPVEDAYAVYEAAGSTQKELKVFTPEEGGAAHCQNDNRLLAHAYMADWLEDVLVRGRTRQGVVVGLADGD